MKTLFLDFCSHQKLFALVVDKVCVGQTELHDHTDEASVMPAIEGLMKKAGYALAELDRIAAVTGPGGFMSQRVGLAVANALAWSLEIPIGGIHLAELYRARATGDTLWIHSTKKQLLFIQGFGKFSKNWPEPTLITLEDLAEIKEGLYVGEVLAEQAAALMLVPLKKIRDISDALPDIIDNIVYKNLSLTPWYGRGA